MQNSPFTYKTNATLVPFGIKEVGPYYWVGHCKNGVDYYAGQTFLAPASGNLKKISLFPSVVFGNADVMLTLYEFDVMHSSWKQKRAETKKHISKLVEGEWMDFTFNDVELDEGKSYGFKISCTNGGLLAIAECPWSVVDPYAEGEEWIGSSQFAEGKFQKDFDLAFEGEIESLFKAKFI